MNTTNVTHVFITATLISYQIFTGPEHDKVPQSKHSTPYPTMDACPAYGVLGRRAHIYIPTN